MDTSGVMLGVMLGLSTGLRQSDIPTRLGFLKEIGALIAFVFAIFCGEVPVDRVLHPLPIAVYIPLLLSFVAAIVVGRCLRFAYHIHTAAATTATPLPVAGVCCRRSRWSPGRASRRECTPQRRRAAGRTARQ